MNKGKLENLESILIIILVLCVIFIIFQVSLVVENKIIFFIPWILLINISLFFLPLINFIQEYSEEKIYVREHILLVLQGIMTLILCYAIYSIFYKPYQYIVDNRTFFSILFYLVIVIFVIAFIKNIRDKVINAKKDSKSNLSFMGRILLIPVGIVFVIAPINFLYPPEKTISLENLKRPISIDIEKNSNKSNKKSYMDIRGLLNRESVEMSDKKLIDKLYNEITNLEIENIRNLDRLYYLIMKAKQDIYYELTPSYETIGMAFGSRQSLDDGFVQHIYIYDNGEIIIKDEARRLGFFDSILQKNRDDYYRVAISKELTEELINKIKALTQNEKE
ncbi:hypothetical protein [Dethiothermospora halolimnae]|uniref:hypothetical protein n=1 Tax=Dethiothermospora halolimnae TaxID=3114390 RepID=UPI003CCBAEA2